MNKELSGGFSVIDMIFGVWMLFCGFLYWNMISIISLGAGVTIFAFVFILSVVLYLKISKMEMQKGKARRDGFVCLAIILISSINFIIFDGTFIKGLNFIFLSLCAVYWIGIITGNRLQEKLCIYTASDFFNQIFVIPFYNFTCCFSSIKNLFADNKKGKGIISAFLGILIFLPILILVINLLMNADAAFEDLFGKIQFSLSEDIMAYVRQIVLGIPVACYMYGLIYGNRYKKNTEFVTLESVDKNVQKLRMAPEPMVYAGFTALNLVYVLYFLSQTAYFFSAFGNVLPETMTYAEYARRGFFELCGVSAINLFVITMSHLLVKRQKIKILKWETSILCMFALVIIATALRKMAMYIDFYGLTQLRVYTCWFMAVMLFIFVVVFASQFKKFNGAKVIIIGFICFFMVLCYGNVDGMIAKYNIERYQNGTLENIDIEQMKNLSDGAVPYIYELYNDTADNKMRYKLKEAIKSGSNQGWMNGPKETFRDFNFQKAAADKIRETI